MDRIAIMQPYIFPYLGYYQLINAVDKFILYDNLNYIKYGWVNRNRIHNVGKSPMYFTIPTPKKTTGKKIREIKIVNDYWRSKFVKSIFLNYKKTEYFEEVFELIENIINYKTDSLSVLNKLSVFNISKYLTIDTRILLNPELDWIEEKLNVDNFKLSVEFPEIKMRERTIKVIRGIAICKYYRAKMFINPIGGIALYPKEEFRNNNLDICFLKMKELRYPQRSAQFNSRLSIIDVLMNCGKDRTKELLNEYVLI